MVRSARTFSGAGWMEIETVQSIRNVVAIFFALLGVIAIREDDGARAKDARAQRLFSRPPRCAQLRSRHLEGGGDEGGGGGEPFGSQHS